MVKNFLKIAFRNLLKRKVYTTINILGLATGMAACLLIVLFIRDELGYDNFQPNGDNIYRVALERRYPGRSTSYAIIPLSIGESIQHEFPEVQECTRMFNIGPAFTVKTGDKIFEEDHVLAVDSNFFHVFQTPLLEGNPATALQAPGTAVVTESAAARYFGSAANAMGKTFEGDNKRHYTITGVCKDRPGNSHFTFSLLLADVTFPFMREPNYTGFSAYTYLVLNNNASPQVLDARMQLIVEKYVSGAIERSFAQTYRQFVAAGNGYHYYLQPLKKIHLTSDLEAELKPNGSIKTVYIFGVIAAFILFIACINFINLSTARSVERAKEVGIRKTFGSEKKALVYQFLVESVLMSLLSLLVAIGIIFLLTPLFNTVSGKTLSAYSFIEPLRLLLLVGFALLVGLVAGLYPAFVLSSFRPIEVLKGKFKSNRHGLALRNGLVVFQFVISVTLIICTIVVNSQMRYMLGDKLGFRKDNVIQVKRTDLLADQIKAFKTELTKIPGVETVSGVSTMPGESNYFGITFQALGSRDQMTGRGAVVDESFADVLGLQLKEGRFFSKDFISDSLAVVINEQAVEELGLQHPLGARLTSTDPNFNARDGSQYIYTVIGVLKDFHYQSLHQKITPLIMANASKFGNAAPETMVRIKSGHFTGALNNMERVWKNFVGERPFQYGFLDQTLADQYIAEQSTQRVFTIFSVLAIFIACMGLLGLAAYATQQRLREISIRKILGASIGGIVGMLSKDFLRLVVISSFIAFPLAWWMMYSWLQQFAYRVGISWWIFVLAAGITALVALVTISVQTIRAALTNPVKTLRSE